MDLGVNRDMERYRAIDFWRTRYSAATSIATSRRLTLVASMTAGDQIRFAANPFVGGDTETALDLTVKPTSRFQSALGITTSRFVDRRNGREEFNVKIVRLLKTYQFTERLLLRNITEHNTFDKTFGENVLFTYRVNAGTVFYLGYDDRYRHGDHINPALFPLPEYQRTNRAIFTKLQYLFRYQS